MIQDKKRKSYQNDNQKRYRKVKVLIVILVVAICALIFAPKKSVSFQIDQPVPQEVAEPAERLPEKHYSPEQIKEWQKLKEEKIVSELEKHFDEENTRIGIAVIKAESSMSSDVVGRNCRYEKTDEEGKTTKYSTSCKKGDEAKAWSIDCGISQINFVGITECPEYTKDIAWSVKKMADMHADRGWKPWTVFTNNSYKRYLD